MSDKKILYKQIDQWINHIHSKSLSKVIKKEEIDSGYVQINPYHYKKRIGQKIILYSEDQDLYIKFYNSKIIDNIENLITRKYEIVKRNTQFGWRLRYAKEKLKSSVLNKNDLFSNLKNDIKYTNKTNKDKFEKHINNLWTFESEFANWNLIILDEHQEKALNHSIKNPVTIITGYAGTGKSQTIKKISSILMGKEWKISRLAPTGRAAQLIKGQTIHSWLEPIIRELPGDKIEIIGFSKNAFQEKECVIIDESSMINNEIWNELKKVWINSKKILNKKVIFVGDPGQLEPVGDGKPFIKLVQLDKKNVFNLEIIHRTEEGNGIISMANFVRKNHHLDKHNNYPNITFIDKKFAYNLIISNPKIQMITPRRKGEKGSLAINKEIKELMNKKEKPISYTLLWNEDKSLYEEDTSIHTNDKLIITSNLWKWNITNGTIGNLLSIEKVRLYNHISQDYSLRQCLKFINPETKKLFYLPNNRKTRTSLELAYAITIHKSQGAEFQTPILYLPHQWTGARMLYTGLTRATEHLFISD